MVEETVALTAPDRTIAGGLRRNPSRNWYNSVAGIRLSEIASRIVVFPLVLGPTIGDAIANQVEVILERKVKLFDRPKVPNGY